MVSPAGVIGPKKHAGDADWPRPPEVASNWSRQRKEGMSAADIVTPVLVETMGWRGWRRSGGGGGGDGDGGGGNEVL
ncbi:hypothetical protein E2C01_064325 [Portunus trituberculatus]|uniref:Uncharacterized protein n=1 Tax=Portunus trituberculatus TaxID=210409 RepID=A0A5B7HK21_PORTR|nr:hypothetical protein [Portunus trituberculatus]